MSHCEIETEFDDMLLRRDGHDPKSFFTASHIRPTAENARVIAPFYEGLTGLQVLDALKGMIAMHRLLQPSGAVKRWVVLTGMKAVGKYDVLHGLVANPQPNPQCTESNEKLDALYQQAIPLAVRLVETPCRSDNWEKRVHRTAVREEQECKRKNLRSRRWSVRGSCTMWATRPLC